jgi:cephalosporin hydroxylase
MKSQSPLNFSCKVLEAMLENKTTTGRSGKIFRNLPALSTLNNLKIIRGLMEIVKPSKTLEIGFAFGGSALVFANWYFQNSLKGNYQHTAIDPFQVQSWDGAGLLSIERAGLAGYLQHIEDFSSIALPGLFKSNHKYGIIYVDGSHIYEDVFIDFYYCSRLLENGGYLLLDDSTDHHVAKVVNFIRKNCCDFLKETNLARILNFDTKRMIKYKVAKLLNKNQLTVFQLIGNPIRPWNVKLTNF